MSDEEKFYPEIGKRYHPDVGEWEEGVEYSFRDGGHELRLHYRQLTQREIHVVQNGSIELGLFYERDILLFLYNFQSIFWGSCVYHWHMIPKEERTIPLLPGHDQRLRVTLSVVLIEASTGIVAALRPVRLPSTFARVLHEHIGEQILCPYDRRHVQSVLTTLEQRGETLDTLWQHAMSQCFIPPKALLN